MKTKFQVKVKSTSGWVYLKKQFKYAEEALKFANGYSKQWCCKSRVVFFEANDLGIREVEVR